MIYKFKNEEEFNASNEGLKSGDVYFIEDTNTVYVRTANFVDGKDCVIKAEYNEEAVISDTEDFGYYLPYPKFYNKVTYNRAITSGKYVTLILPFDVDEELMKRVFGKYYLRECNGVYVKGDNAEFHFKPVKSVEAGVAYLIYLEEDISGMEFYNVVIPANVAATKYEGLYSNVGIYFIGAFDLIAIKKSDNNFSVSNGTIVRYSGEAIKRNRCCFYNMGGYDTKIINAVYVNDPN